MLFPLLSALSLILSLIANTDGIGETGGAGRTAALVVLAGLVGGAMTWGANQLWAYWREKKKDRSDREDRVNDHLTKLVARLDKEKGVLQARDELNRAKVLASESGRAAMRQHCRYLERLLAENGIDYVPCDEAMSEGGARERKPSNREPSPREPFGPNASPMPPE